MTRRSAAGRDSVLVHVDDPVARDRVAGGLHVTRSGGLSAISFGYDDAWVESGFPLNPTFPLLVGDAFLAGGNLRGFLSDAAPDRWGRMLLQRREVALAHAQRRPVRSLTDWDFLLGVADDSRLGAVRFERPGEGFVAQRETGVPPMVRLRDLEQAAASFERGADEPSELAALDVLVEPGSSLGGARPKATLVGEDGKLYIAKFPSRNDRYDVAAWEHLVTRMAGDAGINVPETRLVDLSSEHRTFCAQRFDRAGEKRIGFISAMSMLGFTDGDRASYLDITQTIEMNGARGHVVEDLEQLFRRVVFNVLTGNRDDHLRNHGFLRSAGGWRLSPAFDVNPTTDRATHVLDLDDSRNLPDLDTVRATAAFYRLAAPASDAIVTQVQGVVAGWRRRARSLRIARSEIETLAPAFMVA